MRTLLVVLIAVLLMHVCAAAVSSKAADSKEVEIALSSTTATGLVIGVALVGMLVFSVNMLQGIRISEVSDLPKDGNC